MVSANYWSLAAQVGWLGLRVGGYSALSLHLTSQLPCVNSGV